MASNKWLFGMCAIVLGCLAYRSLTVNKAPLKISVDDIQLEIIDDETEPEPVAECIQVKEDSHKDSEEMASLQSILVEALEESFVETILSKALDEARQENTIDELTCKMAQELSNDEPLAHEMLHTTSIETLVTELDMDSPILNVSELQVSPSVQVTELDMESSQLIQTSPVENGITIEDLLMDKPLKMMSELEAIEEEDEESLSYYEKMVDDFSPRIHSKVVELTPALNVSAPEFVPSFFNVSANEFVPSSKENPSKGTVSKESREPRKKTSHKPKKEQASSHVAHLSDFFEPTFLSTVKESKKIKKQSPVYRDASSEFPPLSGSNVHVNQEYRVPACKYYPHCRNGDFCPFLHLESAQVSHILH